MAVRLKLRIRADERVVDAVALLKSGFEAPTPQLLIPVDIAKALNLWPPEEAHEVVLETAGGLSERGFTLERLWSRLWQGMLSPERF